MTTLSSFFSYNSLNYMIKNLGPQSGFAIDRIIVSHAGKVMKDIFDLQQKALPELQAWYPDFMKGGSLWKKAATDPNIIKASGLMINLGVTLKLREHLREAIRDCVDIYISGLPDLIVAGTKRISGQPSEKEHIIIELLTTLPHFHFIIGYLQRENILAATDTRMIFFFFALLLSIPKYNDIKYNSETEHFTYNLHLFPVGIDGFIQCLSVFTTASDIRDINGGMGLFVDVMASILQQMRQNPSVTNQTQCAFTILVDFFPRSISCIEYGRIGKNFPPSVISEAYRSSASQNYHELGLTRNAGKKGKTKRPKKSKK